MKMSEERFFYEVCIIIMLYGVCVVRYSKFMFLRDLDSYFDR